MRERELQALLTGTDLMVGSHSPGDGVTRYRFGVGENPDFHALRGGITFLGFQQAMGFAQGVAWAVGSFVRTTDIAKQKLGD